MDSTAQEYPWSVAHTGMRVINVFKEIYNVSAWSYHQLDLQGWLLLFSLSGWGYWTRMLYCGWCACWEKAFCNLIQQIYCNWTSTFRLVSTTTLVPTHIYVLKSFAMKTNCRRKWTNRQINMWVIIEGSSFFSYRITKIIASECNHSYSSRSNYQKWIYSNKLVIRDSYDYLVTNIVFIYFSCVIIWKELTYTPIKVFHGVLIFWHIR